MTKNIEYTFIHIHTLQGSSCYDVNLLSIYIAQGLELRKLFKQLRYNSCQSITKYN